MADNMQNPQPADISNILKQQKKTLSLQELRKMLGETSPPERTLRRWLSDLVVQGVIEKIGEKRGARYQCKEVIEEKGHALFSSTTLKSIQYIQQPLFKRQPIAYNESWLENYVPNETFFLPENMRKKLQQQGRRDFSQDPAGTYARKIYHRLLVDLSYNSSRLEGNTYSLLETEKLILEGVSDNTKLDEEKIMILNHKEAIRYLVDNSFKIKVNLESIRTLHYLLSDGLVPAQYSGKVRDHGVRISSSTYVAIESQQRLETNLSDICEKAAAINDPFEQSFFLLAHIAYLQAFIDVNKRTSRLSANIPLIKNNLVPLSFNDLDQQDYINALLVIYELNDPQPLIELFEFSYSRACIQYDVTAEAIGFDEVRVRFRQQRRNLIRDIILKQLAPPKLDEYIKQCTEEMIPRDEQQDFIEDVYEDLTEISIERIVGLGIDSVQLALWKKKQSP